MPTDGDAAPVPGAVPGGRAESHEFSTLTGERADREALGWSRGGLSTKIHLLAPYRQRNVVERAAKKLRGTRAVATRYDKARLRLLRHHRLAAIRIWLRDPPNPISGTRPSWDG